MVKMVKAGPYGLFDFNQRSLGHLGKEVLKPGNKCLLCTPDRAIVYSWYSLLVFCSVVALTVVTSS